ncbi:unnamed protein product [Enterobius vermicularis]|uniref:Acyl_transf_3 domain-containing protein n=1 Tax=Enterobius vermicularis TaxID=51028 RepID=A0A0N4VF54_ENTVE|nr:unnamed protein product [Enterobius vermicularis]
MNNLKKSKRIEVADFLRVVSIFWILGGHTLVTGLLFTYNPLQAIRSTRNDYLLVAFSNSYFAVDIFFFLSGLLLAYQWFKLYSRNGARQLSLSSWILYYVHRLIRLSPTYYITIAFYAFVFRCLMRNMPNFLTEYPETCHKNWWINFLYIQNFVDYQNQCYFPSWYLATDFQLYAFAPLFLIALAKDPWFGSFIAIIALGCSTAVNMITVYAKFFPPSDYPFGKTDPRLKERNSYTFLIYQAPWIRCQVYIIGILTGYYLSAVKKLHINPVANVVLWILSLASCITVVYLLRDWISGDPIAPLTSAFYSAFSRIFWGLSLAYITVSCHYGYGGLIGKFISMPIWTPFGRLTFCAYLTHLCVILWLIGMSDVQFVYSSSVYTVNQLIFGNSYH